MKISKKKSTQLFNVIHEEIMQLRIKVATKEVDVYTRKEIDDLLYKLQMSTTTKALNLFTTCR